MKKFTKLLSICCMCLMSVFLFAGCGVVGYTYAVYSNGSMEETFDISLDASVLTTAGIDVEDTITKLDEIINTWWTTMSSTADFGETIKFTYDTTQPTSRKLNLQFTTTEAYRVFYNIPPTSSNDIKDNIIHNTFCDYLVMCDRNMSLNNFAPLSIYTQLVTYLADKYYSSDVAPVLAQLDDITANIIYIYPAEYMVHSNADYVERNGLYSAHVWTTDLSQLTSANADNQKHMYIYRNYYSADNIANWYLLALGITLIFGIILTITLIIKHRKKITNQNTNSTPLNTTTDSTITNSDTPPTDTNPT